MKKELQSTQFNIKRFAINIWSSLGLSHDSQLLLYDLDSYSKVVKEGKEFKIEKLMEWLTSHNKWDPNCWNNKKQELCSNKTYGSGEIHDISTSI
jgi:hypothetical protein